MAQLITFLKQLAYEETDHGDNDLVAIVLLPFVN
jgi:hypothetical protein